MGALAVVGLAVLLSWTATARAHSLGGDPLVAMAELRASDAPIPLGVAGVSGDTVVASGSAYLGGHVRQVVYVFTRPAGGWSGTPKPAAMLVASDGGFLGGPLALSGQTVVAEGGAARGYVFTEPAGGWSGTVHESAQLAASDASFSAGGLGGWAIDGRTIVAGSGTSGSSTSPGEAYVFTEPAGGWSGKLHESAKLFASRGVDGDGFGLSVAISGQTIAVGAPHANAPPGQVGGRVYVFTEPASGWDGVLHESAMLSASSSGVSLAGPVAVAGKSVVATGFLPGGVAQVYVFTEPANGWSGSLKETAVLSTSDHAFAVDALAASGSTVVAGIYVFTEPAGGWVNATETAKLLPTQGSEEPSAGIDGQTVVAGPNVFVEPSGGWSSSVQPAATLSLTGASGEMLFESVGMSDGVVVADAPLATVGANQNQGAVYVFTEPAGGWSSETEKAKLVASDGRAGDHFGLVAISGDTVVASDSSSQGTVLYVFTKPPGGWSGTLNEAAQLTVTDPGAGQPSSFAISGGTIVASFSGDCGCGSGARAYVFTEPAAGWSGAIHESAKLTVPNASFPCLNSVAIDGPTIAASCSGHAYVFTEPAAGWTGTIQPSATLHAPYSVEPVAVLGSSVVAAHGGSQNATNPSVFNRPASGWSGTIWPAASLRVSGSAQAFDELVAGSGNKITALGIPQSDQSCGIVGTCSVTLYAFTEPSGGWRGAIAGPGMTIGIAEGYPLAIDGSTIATGGVNAIDLFTIPPGAPSVRHASLSGLFSGNPKLRFTLDASQNAAPIRSLKLSLPSALRFARQRIGRTRGVRINASFRIVRLRPGALTVTVRRPTQSLAITIAGPAIIEQNSLIAKVRRIRKYNRTHRRKRTVTLRLHCLVTDATRHSTLLALTTRIS